MYYPFILYFNEYVFNLAAHKTAVKPLCNVFLLSPPSAPAKAEFCTSLHSIYWEERVEKMKKAHFIYICYIDICISGILHSGRLREDENLFTMLWGVFERAKNIFFNRLYSIKNMSFTFLRTQKNDIPSLDKIFF